MPDAHKNFAYSAVATAPSPASSGTSLVVTAGQGALFPAVPFNATVWPAGAQPLTTNAEIVRVTNISTDTLTITREQEGSAARSVVVGDQIAATMTAKTLTDAEGSPAFATNAVILGSSAAAGAAATVMRSNDTIAAFDATNPTTQAFGDAAAVGTAAFAARRDHKHAMMADPFAGTTAAAAIGGVIWTVVTKGSPQNVSTNTTVAADSALLFAAANGGLYEFEAYIIYLSAAGAGTPDIKVAFGEDTVTRGNCSMLGLSSTDNSNLSNAVCNTNGSVAFGTAATNRAIIIGGWYVGTGANAGIYWAQNTSGVNATTVAAGSILRYRRVL